MRKGKQTVWMRQAYSVDRGSTQCGEAKQALPQTSANVRTLALRNTGQERGRPRPCSSLGPSHPSLSPDGIRPRLPAASDAPAPGAAPPRHDISLQKHTEGTSQQERQPRPQHPACVVHPAQV
eukprot:1355366-Pleurochrysis_carterae.AAC.1